MCFLLILEAATKTVWWVGWLLTMFHVFMSGLPRSGKNIWKMKFFPGQGRVKEFCEWSGKFRKDLESQAKIREFENKMAMAGSLQKIYLFCSEGERMYILMG